MGPAAEPRRVTGDDSRAFQEGDLSGTSVEWPEIGYEQALAAYEAGQKLHLGDLALLVRPVPRPAKEGLVLWITDQQTRAEHGLLLFPDGRVEAK